MERALSLGSKLFLDHCATHEEKFSDGILARPFSGVGRFSFVASGIFFTFKIVTVKGRASGREKFPAVIF
jgi:hypothetical protein